MEEQRCKWTEPEAIQGVRDGDTSALEYLYKAYSTRVYTVCLRILKDTAEAEEVTKLVFLQVFRKIRAFHGDSDFWTWLRRIVVIVVCRRMCDKKAMEEPLTATEKTGELEIHDPGASRHKLRTA